MDNYLDTAILFSADLNYVDMDDAINHLQSHAELYWEVGFSVNKNNFHFPLLGFIYIKGQSVQYKIIIIDILPFSPEHYEKVALAEQVKPKNWIKQWYEKTLQKNWKTTFVITNIEQCTYEVTDFTKINGEKVRVANQSYIRVLPPDGS